MPGSVRGRAGGRRGQPLVDGGVPADNGADWDFDRLMSGAEAVTAGLFSRAFPDDEVVQATQDAAAAAARGATKAFLASKELVRRIRDERLALWDAVDIENAAQAALSDTDDYREGFAAFQQKRKPEFHGR